MRGRIALLTTASMVAFAGNSLLCRIALRQTTIDAATFTGLRIASGALCLWLIVRLRRGERAAPAGNWPSALALFVYAATFSLSYVSLTAATGALLLFGAVQATMIGWGLWRGERLGARQTIGLAVAAAGLVVLLLPGLSAPPLVGSLAMVVAGISWAVYTLRGKRGGDPLRVSEGNFMRAVVPAALMCAAMAPWARVDAPGVALALASGALASALGYIVWYSALPHLKVAAAATVQLSVPVLAALGGVVWLAEPLSVRLLVATVAILGGIALVVVSRPPPR